MKSKSICLVLLVALIVFFTADVSFASIKSKGVISKDKLAKKFANKLFDFSLTAVSSETGRWFMLVRDASSKTRDLGWIVYDPVQNRIIKEGKCEGFKYENKIVAVSPDCRHAAVFSRYPSGLHLLDIETGKWSCIHKNPEVNENGLSIIVKIGANKMQDSPLCFVDNDTLASILNNMEVKDGRKVTKDLVSVFYKISEKKLTKGFSYSDLLSKAIKELLSLGIDAEDVRLGRVDITGVNRFACSFYTKDKLSCLMDIAESKVTFIDSVKNGTINFMGKRHSDGAYFYTRRIDNRELNDETGNELLFYHNGEKKVVETGKIFYCMPADNGCNLIAKVASGGTSLAVLFGKPGEKQDKIDTLIEQVLYGMDYKGKVIYLYNVSEIKWYVMK